MEIQTGDVIQAPASWVIDGNTESFNEDVVQASAEKLVIVDLWAPWCGPCKQLGPTLEKITNNAGGAVSLVKIDIDQNPQIAQALRVQSIPAVFAFRDGQPVDAFMGALPESKVKEFIEKSLGGPIGPSELEEALATGVEALENDNTEVALSAFAGILETDPDHVEAKAHLSRVYLKLGEAEAAGELLGSIDEADRDNKHVSAAYTALSLAENAADSSELAPMIAKVDTDPDNLEDRFALAQALIGAEKYEDGGDHLLEIIRRDNEWNDSAARQELLKIFEVLGPMHDISKDLRRKLSSLLFS
jgi:putative thioredoxin